MAALLLAGCWLPVGTSAPQSATTVGKGGGGISLHGEAPTIDLLATQTEDDVPDDDYALMPWPTFSLGFQYGLLENFDAELSIDGTWLLAIPIPYGISVGGRLQLVYTETVALALAAKAGWISASQDEGDAELSATYGDATLAGQLRNAGRVRPGLSLSAIPIRVRQTFLEDPAEDFNAFAANATVSVTLAFGRFEVGPFVSLVHFRSPNLRGASTFGTGGIIFALRGQKDPPVPPVAIPGPPGG
jgi:hypothetical protein